MSWLASLIVAIASSVVTLLVKDISEYMKKQKAIALADAAASAASAASVKPLIDAKTGQEVSDATRGAMDGT